MGASRARIGAEARSLDIEIDSFPMFAIARCITPRGVLFHTAAPAAGIFRHRVDSADGRTVF